jgi:MFS family permease
MKKTTALLQEFHHITLDYALMLVMLFFMRAGQFMLLPFLAIYLAKFSNTSPAIIGLTIGIGPFVYGVANLCAGILVDRFGAKKIMAAALLLGGATFFAFFYQQTIVWCFLMNALTGITRGFFDISSKSYNIAGLSFEQRKTSFSLRFMAVNSAAAIGPIIGAYFAAANAIISFKIVGLFYIFLGIVSIFFLKNIKNPAQEKLITFRSLIKIFRNDASLQILVAISIIIMMVFSQIDSTLPQYLCKNLNHGVKIYSILLIINALICVTMQLVVSKLTNNIREYSLSSIGLILFSTSYAMFAFFVDDIALMLAMVILTLAEIIIMPLNDLLLARLAPPNRLGTYYGIAGFAMLGLGIGPMIGGFVYEYLGAKILFIGCSSLCLLTLILYKKLIYAIPNNTQLLP